MRAASPRAPRTIPLGAAPETTRKSMLVAEQPPQPPTVRQRYGSTRAPAPPPQTVPRLCKAAPCHSHPPSRVAAPQSTGSGATTNLISEIAGRSFPHISKMSNRLEENSFTGWTFLSNHAHVLVCLARDPGRPLRLVAQDVGITERATQRIVADLEAAGALERRRVGRNNHYRIFRSARLRHPLERSCRVGQLLDALG